MAIVYRIVREHVATFPEMSVWRCALAFVHAELGQRDGARENFEILARGSFASIQRPRGGTCSRSRNRVRAS